MLCDAHNLSPTKYAWSFSLLTALSDILFARSTIMGGIAILSYEMTTYMLNSSECTSSIASEKKINRCLSYHCTGTVMRKQYLSKYNQKVTISILYHVFAWQTKHFNISLLYCLQLICQYNLSICTVNQKTYCLSRGESTIQFHCKWGKGGNKIDHHTCFLGHVFMYL